MRQRKMCKGQQMKAITADSRGSCMNLLNADAAAGRRPPPHAANCRQTAPRRALPLPRAVAAAADVNSSCRFSCTKKRGLERARHYAPRLPLPIRHPCRRADTIAPPPPAPSYKVKAASYDNILLRRCTGARKTPYQCARRGLGLIIVKLVFILGKASVVAR